MLNLLLRASRQVIRQALVGALAHRPVPVIMDVQPLEQLLARVEEQALAEAPRPRQEVVLALVEQPPDVGGFVDVVTVLLAELAEVLDAMGSLRLGMGRGSFSRRYICSLLHYSWKDYVSLGEVRGK